MKYVPPGGYGHNNELHPPSKIEKRDSRRVQRLRNGFDLSWLIVILLILIPIIAGVLTNKGIL
jgi:hypothetical protein